MKPPIAIVSLVILALVWVALDATALGGLVGTLRAWQAEAQRTERAADRVERLVAEVEKDLPAAHYALATYHLGMRSGGSRAYTEALGKRLGAPSQDVGWRHLKKAVAAGHRRAQWTWWDRMGWPSEDSLHALTRSGNVAAAYVLLQRSMAALCRDPNALDELEKEAVYLRPTVYERDGERRLISESAQLLWEIQDMRRVAPEACQMGLADGWMVTP